MPETLADKLGDHGPLAFFPMPRKILTPRQVDVTVRRRGVEVELVIGNTDPVRFAWADAMRTGLAWMREALRAKRQNRPAELRINNRPVSCHFQAARKIGHWLLAKGTEAKWLDGHPERLDC